MKIKFWGVRGSIPTPGKNFAKFGGNTSCVELIVNNKVIIFDMGSGLVNLGDYLLKKNIKNFDVIVGMYHDQVLTPVKTLYEYDAVNITLGLPFIRVSPDHGPNEKMMGKNISNPLSLIRAISFLDKHWLKLKKV